MRLVLLLSFVGLCVGTFLDVHIDLDVRLVAGCSVGLDATVPVSTSFPPENLVKVVFRNNKTLCDNPNLGATLFPNGTLVFYMNGTFESAQCTSNGTSLAPCTVYLTPNIAVFYLIKPTGMYPDCSAPNSLLLGAPTPVTTEPTIDVRLSGGAAISTGYCTGYVYLYYTPPQQIRVTTVPNSPGACDNVLYNYTVESNGDITHYVNSSNFGLLSCRTTAANSTCTDSVASPSVYYSYTVSMLRYGTITRPIGGGTCGLSLAPTAPTPFTAPTVSLAPTSNSTNGAVGMVRLLPGLLFFPLSVLLLFSA